MKIVADNKSIKLEINRHYLECKHPHFMIDPALEYVECAACKERLNPMWCLEQLAIRGNRAANQYEQFAAIKKDLDRRKKVKCEHCGKFTDVPWKVKP